MFWNYFKECYTIIEGALDGAFGWYWDVLTLLLVVGILNFGIKNFLKCIENYCKKHHKFDAESLISAIYTPFSYYSWYFAFIECFDFVTNQIFQKNYIFNKVDKKIVLAMGFVLACSWFLMRWKSNIVLKIAKSSQDDPGNLDANRIDVINKLVTVAIILLTIALLLKVTGRSLNTLMAFGGLSGVAIAVAAQEMIASFFGGLMIYLTQPFVIGDYIKLLDRHIEGNIIEIGWYTTQVRMPDKCPVYVPNSLFSKIVVVNFNRMTHRRLLETIGIRYSDMPVLRKTIADLKDLLDSEPNVDHAEYKGAYFTHFGTSSLDIEISAYINETCYERFNQIKEEMLFKIIETLSANGAEISLPTTYLEMPGPPPKSARQILINEQAA